MKLYASPTSPYARIVRVVVHEKQLDSRIEFVWVDPWASPASLLRVNPFSRVPSLQTEEGPVLTESLLIALYLERRFPEPKLAPRDRMEAVYHKLGLAQGLIDAAVAIVSTRKFHTDADRDPLVRRRLETIPRSLPGVAGAADGAPDRPDMGDLALAVGLSYLDFRLPGIDWKAGQPDLAEWHRIMSTRPSLERTRPPEA